MKILHVENKYGSSEILSHGDNINLCEVAKYSEITAGEINHQQYDLLIADFKKETFSLIRDIRLEKLSIPILILSGAIDKRDSLTERISSLSIGADDVMSIPFDSRELSARAIALIRRSIGNFNNIISIGKLSIDLASRMAFVNGTILPLTKTEYSILELLMLRKNRIQTKDAILEYVYSGRDEPDLKIIDVYVCHIRNKIALLSGGEAYITTVWGRGCMIMDNQPIPSNPPIPSNSYFSSLDKIYA